MSCGVAYRRSSDLVLLWLWCRPMATAPIRPLAWEPPYAEGAALEKTKKKKKKHDALCFLSRDLHFLKCVKHWSTFDGCKTFFKKSRTDHVYPEGKEIKGKELKTHITRALNYLKDCCPKEPVSFLGSWSCN